MSDPYIRIMATELQVRGEQVSATLALLDAGGTVPFIARYRKEVTGSLDEVAVAAIRDRVAQLRELDKRRETILGSLAEHGHLTDELERQVREAETLTQLEDVYLPYRPKRRTRATMARERGLQPLADVLLEQRDDTDPSLEAAAYVDEQQGVTSVEEALAGARDVIAESVNEHAEARSQVRQLFMERGLFRARVIPGKEEEGSKYRDYFAWEEPVATAPSHRVLAMRRGERELFLTLRVVGPEEEILAALDAIFLSGENACAEQVRLAIREAYKRLLSVSMETEVRMAKKVEADTEAIRIFAENLRQLLLASPLGQKAVLAIDPGFRTGCKVVCLDRQGKLLETEVIYPDRHPESAAEKVQRLCTRCAVEAIAIGNGTGGRETEAFIRRIGLPTRIPVVLVNESGASVYSASEVARQEFPDHDLTIRGAVSIGRRLMDPLAELVKIEPKSIGVGQYQHDVDQHALKQSLDDVVVSCVNSVGVEVNTASRELLTYVSGLGPQLAGNIVAYRNEHGPFRSRSELIQVPRLGPRAFELAAGFLRIRDAAHPLDASAVHPERYALVDRLAHDLDCSVAELVGRADVVKRLRLADYMDESIGLPTLEDIAAELVRPGRDPREEFAAFAFAAGVEKLEDLEPGMQLPGVVTNITAFGAFVDVGVHQDGLVHVSQLSDRFVRDPNEIVQVGKKVKVRVLDVDLERGRIALTLRPLPEAGGDQHHAAQEGTEQGAGTAGGNAQTSARKRPALRGETRGGRRPAGGGKRQRPERTQRSAPATAMAEALRKVGIQPERRR